MPICQTSLCNRARGCCHNTARRQASEAASATREIFVASWGFAAVRSLKQAALGSLARIVCRARLAIACSGVTNYPLSPTRTRTRNPPRGLGLGTSCRLMS
jgi:hypothetical protein